MGNEETAGTRAPESEFFFDNSDAQSDKYSPDSNSEDSGPQSRVDMKHGRPTSRSVQGVVNILLMGDVQSGKTSLIETMKQHSDSDSITHEEYPVYGVKGTADEIIRVTSFQVSLRKCEIHVPTGLNSHHHIVDIEEDARALSQEEFDNLLNLAEGNFSTHIIPSGAKKY